MDSLSPYLVSLRQEITDLCNLNVLYSQQSVHSAIEQTASDERARRLLQIKQELSKMRDCPPEPMVWWDKVRKPKGAA
jgi:molybdenum cofactor biosynthesis enzyme MoaA